MSSHNSWNLIFLILSKMDLCTVQPLPMEKKLSSHITNLNTHKILSNNFYHFNDLLDHKNNIIKLNKIIRKQIYTIWTSLKYTKNFSTRFQNTIIINK